MTQASVKPGTELRAACHALCQSGRFETGQGGCAAICMDVLGSSRGGPHGCPHVERVHGELAQSVLSACNAYPELIGALGEAREVVDAAVELAAGMRGRVANADRSHANLKGLLAKIDALLARRQS